MASHSRNIFLNTCFQISNLKIPVFPTSFHFSEIHRPPVLGPLANLPGPNCPVSICMNNHFITGFRQIGSRTVGLRGSTVLGQSVRSQRTDGQGDSRVVRNISNILQGCLCRYYKAYYLFLTVITFLTTILTLASKHENENCKKSCL